jgi:predicted enzyme related to lactoylglutathione lyase
MPETPTVALSALTWFEIPVADFDRARRFYETILETTLKEHQFGPGRIALFPYDENGVGGCLDEKSESRPSETGAVIYLPVHGRIDRALELVPAAGGRVAVPKNDIPEVGSVAHVIDSEGNRVGLHSKN